MTKISNHQLKNRQATPALRRNPTQKRSLITIETILEAASKVLGNEGYEGFTTNNIAEVAGVSIGTLYQYFENREAIAQSLYIETINEISLKWKALVFDQIHENVDETLPKLTEIVIALYKEKSHIIIDLPQEIPLLRDNSQVLTLEKLIYSSNRMVIAQHYDIGDTLISESAVYLCCATFLENIKKYINSPSPQISQELFVDQLSKMIISYLKDLNNSDFVTS